MGLAAFSQRELGKCKAPKVFKLMASLPKGPSSKVQRLKSCKAELRHIHTLLILSARASDEARDDLPRRR
jgi:acyl-coenzyme A synthetase/AMP-(fatty) acid ligase